MFINNSHFNVFIKKAREIIIIGDDLMCVTFVLALVMDIL